MSVLPVTTDRFWKGGCGCKKIYEGAVCAFVARCGPSFSSFTGGHSFVARTAPPLVARNRRIIFEVSIRTRFGV